MISLYLTVLTCCVAAGGLTSVVLHAGLNGDYQRAGSHNQNSMGIRWNEFKGQDYSYKFAEMKVAPQKN